MRGIGNVFIFLGLAVFSLLFIVPFLALVSSLLFSCAMSNSGISCANEANEPLYNFFSVIMLILPYWILPITVPLFGLGIILKTIDKKNPASEDSQLEKINYTVGRLYARFLMLIIVVIFWWATIVLIVYNVIKMRSLTNGIRHTLNLLFGFRKTPHEQSQMNEIQNMEKHYICLGGCRGVSEHPGVCQAPDCANHQHELVECTCTDGLHNNFQPTI